MKTDVPHRDLKTMVESYKTRAPQEKEARPRESACEKLDTLAKETAAKVTIDKPKAKIKAKKGPELKKREAATKLPQYIWLIN